MSGLDGLPELKCLRCGHTWVPRKSLRPLRCAKCKSPYWGKPRRACKRRTTGNRAGG